MDTGQAYGCLRTKRTTEDAPDELSLDELHVDRGDVEPAQVRAERGGGEVVGAGDEGREKGGAGVGVGGGRGRVGGRGGGGWRWRRGNGELEELGHVAESEVVYG